MCQKPSGINLEATAADLTDWVDAVIDKTLLIIHQGNSLVTAAQDSKQKGKQWLSDGLEVKQDKNKIEIEELSKKNILCLDFLFIEWLIGFLCVLFVLYFPLSIFISFSVIVSCDL